MNIDEIMSVSGLPGLYRLVANRHNGLVVEDLDSGDKRFCSVRKHQFTPLGSIAIYTDLDSISLKRIFERMREQKEDNPVPDPKAPEQELFEYFADVVPDYDRDRVYQSDIKKVIKWYIYLEEHDLMDQVLSDDAGTGEEEE